MKRLTTSIIATLALVVCAHAQSGAPVKPRAVVELFTSQGCSSCPPADKLLTELGNDPELIVLTMPVDYWDYLGWKDTLAQPEFTQRQKAYAAMRSDRQVYTPQAVVNGMAHAIGSQKAAIDKAISKTRDHASTLALMISVVKNDSGLNIKLPADSIGAKTGIVWVLPIANSREVKIGRGENSGRSVTYSNVVLKMTPVAAWNGEAMSVTIPASSMTPDAEGVVVLLQSGSDKKASQILGAGRLAKL
jgi:hypothetical protein